MWLLTCYTTMLPRFQAEEALRAVQVRNASDLRVDMSARSRIIRRWQTIATGGRQQHRTWISEMPPAQQRAVLASAGFYVVN